MILRRSILSLALAVTFAGCNSNSTSPTPLGTSSTTFLPGTVAQGATAVVAFSLSAAATVNSTLVSMTSASGAVLAGPVTFGVGSLIADGSCVVAAPVVVSPALVTQISTPLQAGTYCASVTDTGALPEAANFAVRVVTITGVVSSPVGNQTTDTFASNLTVNGTATREFLASGTGTATATLLTAGTGSPIVGFGIGAFDGAVCQLTKRIDRAAGTDDILSVAVEAGSYCIKIFDLGTLTSNISFTSTVDHP